MEVCQPSVSDVEGLASPWKGTWVRAFLEETSSKIEASNGEKDLKLTSSLDKVVAEEAFGA